MKCKLVFYFKETVNSKCQNFGFWLKFARKLKVWSITRTPFYLSSAKWQRKCGRLMDYLASGADRWAAEPDKRNVPSIRWVVRAWRFRNWMDWPQRSVAVWWPNGPSAGRRNLRQADEAFRTRRLSKAMEEEVEVWRRAGYRRWSSRWNCCSSPNGRKQPVNPSVSRDRCSVNFWS